MLHKEIYEIGKKLPKGDKLGIHATVEKYTLELLATTIAASLTSRKEKIPILKGGAHSSSPSNSPHSNRI
ncbi:MAG: hypothetical protein A3C08_00710 [Candidatus Taylorbacteria bacterium RIFCSPHIGHO2_02_FULL_47_18]|uniref:Uncharacterized protein n=1 Tax=Candidatus Taylorbacteria bacterium RIFCSPLOWO2_01_FULL_48_100 TaxID=1802322 RepID=A0A1G2NER8_9BACT|nr:MAG: hypothetical protein A3C08_00710 [Candidatus Taylorbacteria bacterium RIFCSPHIGHO2_02_FULL_47_18]OHA34556.1 MAG: hypothetical protein A2938_03330 [Candidatus Taylorbacteria bacterium RIFCSPLOWO2_01_FULL_48_100]OHA40320.1 MAG: hypothetical protein A3J31_01805 [Candidatus Taylorbacteria bacterium RIFCSPLOWO2_02_FULL_48_16]OHA44979.1 MAG: hypothetical protein A3H13_03640 [Candidatus Taylorbacteria bacterium RIFCSPLOWO2_12_FULL_48_11]